MIMTLSEIMKTCKDWDKFCEVHGYSVWAVAEGGGDVQVTLTLKEAAAAGIIASRHAD